MAKKHEHYSHIVRRLPKAMKSLDQLLASKNEMVKMRAVALVIDKCIPSDIANFNFGDTNFNLTIERVSSDEIRKNRDNNRISEYFEH